MLSYGFSISERDRGFIAGFFEGEACFRVTELNGGQSYACGVTLCVRDDDQDLVEWLVAVTGFGRLRRIPARRTSRPQICWSIDARDDCAALSRLLAQTGFHGRRSTELEIWHTAVSAWTELRGDDRRAALSAARYGLQSAKRYGCGSAVARPLARDGREATGYISGLVCAEGCFHFSGDRPRFGMHLRRDDRPLLELLRATTGSGAIYDHRPRMPVNPSSSWIITARDQLERFAAMLCAAEVPGRKGSELRVWEVAVSEVATAGRLGLRPRKAIVRAAAARLRATRRYAPSTRDLLELNRRELRSECLAALNDWGATTDGPLACGDYSRWRRDNPGRPTRNTVAKEFGSWHVALAAAGLRARAAREPRSAGGDAARQRRRNAQRARVSAAVRQFEAEHGRLPRAMEFFTWRLEKLPDSPSQATVYNLFPGGWSAVLRTLDDHDDTV